MKKKEITIINLGINNIKKIINAFDYLDATVKIAQNRKDILNANRILLPGLGSYNSGMSSLSKLKVIDGIYEFVFIKKRPIFGICLGMQLFFENSEEFSKTKGLGFLEGSCKLLETSKKEFINIPHIGWNKVIPSKKKIIQYLINFLKVEIIIFILYILFMLKQKIPI